VQKILILAAVVFSLAAAALGFLNHGKLVKAKADVTKFQTESTTNAKKAEKASVDLKAANEKLAVAGSDIEKTSAELAELKSQSAKSTGLVTDLQKQLADKDALIAQQKTDMAAKDTRISELETKASQTTQPTNSPTDDLKKQLEEKDLLASSLQSKLKDQETQLSALKEREAQRKSKSLRPGLEGRILAVNASWNFVVLSLGDRNGVVNGAEMLIKRGAQLIGKVRITSVEPSTSIADIVPNSIRGSLTVQPGDSVIYSGPAEDNEPKLQ
jgi:small-conductance mechanosensitive channel